MNNFTGKKINFDLSRYISEGFDFYKKNFSDILVAYLCTMVMSLIPFCSYLAIGNFLKYLRKLRSGQRASVSEIFNFDDFVPYLKMGLILFGLIVLLEIPVFLFLQPWNIDRQVDDVNFNLIGFMYLWFGLIYVALFYLMARAFYIPGLISLRNIKSLRQAWDISGKMAHGNMWLIVGYLLIVGFLGSIGIFACFVGIIITAPFVYTAQYFAMEDGLQQSDGGAGAVSKTGNAF